MRGRRDSGPFGIWWFRWAVLALLTITAGTVAAAALVDSEIHQRLAAREAAGYVPPALDNTPKPLVTVVGDSYTGGSAMNSSEFTLWTALITSDLDIRMMNLGVGGSGYITRGAATADTSTFEERASKVPADSSVVVFFGSRNDGAADPTKLHDAALHSFQTALKIAPKAKLVVIGPPWVDSSPPAAILSDRDAIKKAANQVHATWVDPVADDWFPTGSGLIGSDGVHPTDAGHQHLATLIEPIVKTALGR